MTDNALAVSTNNGVPNAANLLAEKNENLLVAYAINPNADPDLLSVLAAHENYNVKGAVAKNPNTPPEILDYLADCDSYCALCVAQNPRAPEKTLARILANSEWGEQAFNNALANPSTPLETAFQSLLSYLPTSTAIAVKSNERFNKLMGVVKEMDAQAREGAESAAEGAAALPGHWG